MREGVEDDTRAKPSCCAPEAMVDTAERNGLTTTHRHRSRGWDVVRLVRCRASVGGFG